MQEEAAAACYLQRMKPVMQLNLAKRREEKG